MPVTVGRVVDSFPWTYWAVTVRTSPTAARARSLTATSPGRSGRAPAETRCQRRAASSATVPTERYCEPERPGTAACTDVSQDGATAATDARPATASASSATEEPPVEVTTAAAPTYWAPTASSTVLRAVWFRTRVATTNPTAMTTASVEASRRAACDRTCARRTVRTGQAPSPASASSTASAVG